MEIFNPWVMIQLGIVIGVAIRTFYPYIKKQSEGEVCEFEKRYYYLMLVALITIELGIGMLVASFGTEFIDTMPPMAAFFAGVFIGVGNNEMINRIFPKPLEPVEPEPTNAAAPQETHYNLPTVTLPNKGTEENSAV